MLKAYFLDVKAGEHTLNRFDGRFAHAGEAIQHSKELAAMLRHRHFNNQPCLVIVVLDPSSRKIHEGIVYPDGE